MLTEEMVIELQNITLKINDKNWPRSGSNMKLPKIFNIFRKKKQLLTEIDVTKETLKTDSLNPVKLNFKLEDKFFAEIVNNSLVYSTAVLDNKLVKRQRSIINIDPKHTKIIVKLNAYEWKSLYSTHYYLVDIIIENGEHKIELLVRSLALYIAIARGEVLREWETIDETGLFYLATQYDSTRQASFERQLNQLKGGYFDIIKNK